jgi:hypothetical protein
MSARRGRTRTGLAVALALGLAAPAGAAATVRTVEVPLVVDHTMLARALLQALRHAEGDGATDSPASCTSLSVDHVTSIPVGSQVEIRAGGHGRIGLPFLRWCLLPLGMDGALRVRGTPTIGDDWRLRLQDVDAVILNPDGDSTFVSRRVTKAAAPEIVRAVSDFALDLGPPAREARALLRDSLRDPMAARALAIVESLRPLRVAVDDDGVRVVLAMDLPPGDPDFVGPPAPLTAEERARWHAALDRWDAFLVFVVKRLGLERAHPAVLEGLFEIFLNARHRLAGVIDEGPRPGEDPVRALFLESWAELRAVVRRLAREGPPEDRLLRYLTFLTAGDALAALEEGGSGLGLEISADGLRRLARTIDPDAVAPLADTGDAVDPVLRKLLGFHEPGTRPPPPPEPHSWWSPFVGTAHAGDAAPRATIEATGHTLDRWVPNAGERSRYRDLVGTLLDATALVEREASAVPPSLQRSMRTLVRATAWQESCWRHFLRDGDRVVVLRSRSGDVGIMQVNRHVWRGVFDVTKLEWDIAYNVGAGVEILAQLLRRYGPREAARAGGHASRAAYSAYQGGPSAHHRYRTGTRATPYTRGVDRAFWKKLQTTERGEEIEHVPCGPLRV